MKRSARPRIESPETRLPTSLTSGALKGTTISADPVNVNGVVGSDESEVARSKGCTPSHHSLKAREAWLPVAAYGVAGIIVSTSLSGSLGFVDSLGWGLFSGGVASFVVPRAWDMLQKLYSAKRQR